jgi:hypothetical protein
MATQAPTVRARSGSASANVVVHRPSWADMEKYYPAEPIKSASFYPMVSKWYALQATNQDRTIAANYENTCAARMSYALNRSGLRLPPAPNGGSIKGDDGYNYWLRVAQLSQKLKTQFGSPDKQLSHQPLSKTPTQDMLNSRVANARSFIRDISSRKGIIVFEVTGWWGATGHFTLWDGANLKYVGEGQHNDSTSYEYYFWLVRTNPQVQTMRVLFWELK